MVATRSAFHRLFPDNAACIRYLMKLRYSNTACPACKRFDSYSESGVNLRFTCSWGRHHLYPLAGTIAGKSPIPQKIFFAVWLFWKSDKLPRVREIEAELDVAYPTAWRIRKLLKSLPETDGQSFVRYLETVFAA
ncbi:MAG: hypothetical protein AAFX06_32820 [Planctomycetota bacterium]